MLKASWENCLTWRLVGGFEVLISCRQADEPAVRVELCDGNKQGPAHFAGEVPLASVHPITAAFNLIVLQRGRPSQEDALR